ncbi:MAG: hypothetical protein JNJ57_19965 [Saprospiraceae bacterium]|nr:hypothetical protein [Saprospiraceae bacterium]
MMRIHVFGAPGSGVSTLGKALAARLAIPHFDTDDYHWFTSDPLPYKRRRNPDHRRQLLEQDLSTNEHWVLSGALCGWGDVFVPLFDQVIWLWLPVEERLARIRMREQARYGAERIEPGGDLHVVFQKFTDWAGAYDQPSGNIRSKAFELQWLEQFQGRVLKIETPFILEEMAAKLSDQFAR